MSEKLGDQLQQQNLQVEDANLEADSGGMALEVRKNNIVQYYVFVTQIGQDTVYEKILTLEQLKARAKAAMTAA